MRTTCASGELLAGALEWALCSRPIASEMTSGDVHVAADCDGRAVLGVIDGLGHGPAATEAARTIASAVVAGDVADLGATFNRCHDAARHTRGAAMSLAVVDDVGALVWAGVGNVTAVVVSTRGREHLTLRGGIVGDRAISPRVATLQLARGDVLVFYSDGLRAEAASSIAPYAPCAETAAMLVADAARADDDALVLVSRWRGARA